jgi:hypothetical protein
LVEDATGGADEGSPSPIFRISRLLADEDHARLGGAFPEHGLRGRDIETAAFAGLGSLAELRKSLSLR